MLAATIRQELKTELGLTARQVSVRTSRGGHPRVTVRVAGVPLAAVKKVAERQQRIRYDEATQCILRGGNTFVSVSLDDQLLDGPAAAILPWLEALPVDYSAIHAVPGAEDIEEGLGVSREHEHTFKLWAGGRCADQNNALGVAYTIASYFVELGRESKRRPDGQDQG